MPDTPVGEALHHLMHAYKRALRQAYVESNLTLTVSHLRALKTIRGAAPCTAQQVAQRLKRDKAQITRLLRDLHDLGAIARQPNPQDHRSRMLTLTETGEAILTQVDACEHEAHRRLADGLDADDLDTFVRLARRMIDNLQ